MARYTNGGLGEFRGSIGDLVIYRWRHLTIGRRRPGKTRRKKSTLPQKIHRSRLGLISRYLSRLVFVVRDGFNTKRMNMTSMNAAVKENFHTAVTGEFPNMTVERSLIKLSKGTLDNVYRPIVVQKENGTVAIEWTQPERQKPGVEDHDKVHVVLYNDLVRLRRLFYLDDLARRADCYVDLTDSVRYMNAPIHIWIFLVSADGKRPSNSRYLGAFDFKRSQQELSITAT
jgi:hypothetical protein